MDHEPLHNDRGDFDLRLNNKVKKDKDKTDSAERKKWNFRRTSATEMSGDGGPTSAFGLINQSEPRSKRTVSPTMIFENTLSDHDEPNDVLTKSPPTTLNFSQTVAQQTLASPKAATVEQRLGTTITRARQKSLPLSTSPPALINRPQSVRKPGERIRRQVSVPAKPVTLLQQQSLSSLSPTQPERHDLRKTTNDQQTNIQWQTVQQPYFNPDSLTNVIEKPHENQLHRSRALSDNDKAAVEEVDNNQNTMWKGNQDTGHGKWAEFLSPTNDVFVPDDKAWAGTDNIVVEADDEEEVVQRSSSHSSQSSNSSESDIEDTEENVWKINEEQKAYYLNQFRVLQPAEKGVVAGQKARDFFLKSGLGVDVLSKIWNLADLDSDGALNFEEFCIAMHIVVAVRHGLDVPATLPQYLIPEKYEAPAANATAPMVETNGNELSLQDSSQSWARFSPDPRNPKQPPAMLETDGAIRTVQAQTVHHSSQQAGQHLHSQHTHQANQHAPQSSQNTQQHPQTEAQPQQNQQVSQHPPVAAPEQTVTPQVQNQAATQHRRVERTKSEPSSADENIPKDNSSHTPRKISLGIPRVRGQPKQTNLLDTPHWAILPPPSKFNKENPEETNKGSHFVPTGTIIPADPEDSTERVIVEKPEQSRESDSSSSETEQRGDKDRVKSLSREDSESNGDMSKNSSDDDSLRPNQDVVDSGKKMPAPQPPPRRRSGHSRSSSLDLQKLFNKGNTQSLQNATDYSKEASPTQGNQPNFADFSKFESATASHSNENLSRPVHRRTASLDSAHAIFIEPTPQPAVVDDDIQANDTSNLRPEIPVSVPRPVPRKKPASPPPPLSRQKKDVQQDSGSDSMVDKEKKISKEPIHFVVKPLTRLEQLHAKIRDLKTKNTRLSRINNELQQELKEMMGKRVGLESSLEQLKPFAK
ncbi:ralBP1-associated Eps domain-containing protein 1-like isoform X2 [Dendronephthya gigantea]|uniref:ralBP1-associated Eps domain-containing protein 1-like isoform X2 n=1 Tax=Dendronephthya gigantea TaxID=151771 RepID=UPI001068F000|nr:ralBP1-associated Eps domain-containing protein 1-like isoform X2 [Dendronephthya gigantea]